MESERLKSLGSGGDRKNRGQREGTGREEEGEAVRGERSRAGGREMLKVGENGGGGLKKQGQSGTQFSLSPWIQQALMSGVSCLYVVSVLNQHTVS